MNIYDKKFNLGDEVIISKDYDGHLGGRLAKIIGVTARQRNFYATDYVLAVKGHVDRNGKYIKLHIDEHFISKAKLVKAYCYEDDHGVYYWKSSETPEPCMDKRVPELDFERILKGN